MDTLTFAAEKKTKQSIIMENLTVITSALNSLAPITILACIALTIALAFGRQIVNKWNKVNHKYHIITYGCADVFSTDFYDDDEL